MLRDTRPVVEKLFAGECMPSDLPPFWRAILWSRLLAPGAWFLRKVIDSAPIVSIPFTLLVLAFVADWWLYVLPAGAYLLFAAPRAWHESGRRIARAWNRVCREEARFTDAHGRSLPYRAATSRPEDRS